MATTIHGRYTARIQDPFVVFLIGTRVNRPWRVRDWWPVAAAMPPMVRELERQPEKGFLGAESFIAVSAPGLALVQYWRSLDHLDRFARDRDDLHLPAWREFNRRVAASGSVGIWHESYLVEAGRYEAAYANMPRFGLARAAEHVPATGSLETARRRLGGDSEPAVDSSYRARHRARTQRFGGTLPAEIEPVRSRARSRIVKQFKPWRAGSHSVTNVPQLARCDRHFDAHRNGVAASRGGEGAS